MSTPENERVLLLRDYLDAAREAMIWKCQGLTDTQARTPMTPTGTHAMGLLLHLSVTETGYFFKGLDRKIEDPVIRKITESEDPHAEFLPPEEMSLADVIALYKSTTTAVDEVLDELPLDTIIKVPWRKSGQATLERILVHMIAETHRHAGHLDLIRELLDGFVGLYPGAPSIADLSEEQWNEQYQRVQRLAAQEVTPKHD